MYRSFEHFDRHVGCSGFATSTAQPPATVLTLPRIAGSVPVEIGSKTELDTILFARRLSALGIITTGDISNKDSLSQVISKCLNRRLNEITGEIFASEIQLAFNTKSAAQYTELHEHFENLADEQSFFIAIEISTYNIFHYRIEEAVRKLNIVHPDLGQTIYAILDEVSLSSFPIDTFTSCIAHRANELNFVSDCDFDGMDEFERGNEEHEITQLSKQFPFDWVINPKRILSLAEIEDHARSSDISLIADVLKAAITVVQTDVGNKTVGYTYKINAHSYARVIFDEYDPTLNLVDQFYESTRGCEVSYTENVHEQFMDISTDKTFREDWTKFESGLRLVGATNKLLSALHKLNIGENS